MDFEHMCSLRASVASLIMLWNGERLNLWAKKGSGRSVDSGEDLDELRNHVTGAGRWNVTDLEQECSAFDKGLSPWDDSYFRVDP